MHRASISVVRTCIRPGIGAAPLRRFQLRQQSTVSSDGDIGGLGGQQAPPPGRGDRDFIKQNWYRLHDDGSVMYLPRHRVRLRGAALIIAIGVSYMSSPPKKTELMRDMKAANSTEIGMQPPTK
ncbi:hypothetical protein NW759_017297 [Fusarium solani]|nr:hypothetical protein NW759_017297 [Fusarium solani]